MHNENLGSAPLSSFIFYFPLFRIFVIGERTDIRDISFTIYVIVSLEFSLWRGMFCWGF